MAPVTTVSQAYARLNRLVKLCHLNHGEPPLFLIVSITGPKSIVPFPTAKWESSLVLLSCRW
jgi:hypothetical protein